MFTNIFFPALPADALKVLETPAPKYESKERFNSQIIEEMDILCPVNEITGLRDSVLTKITDPALSPLERERLMSTLQRMPASKRNNLSDADLIAMTPSRYNTTFVDDAKFAEHLRGIVDEVNASDTSVDGDGDGADSGVGDGASE